MARPSAPENLILISLTIGAAGLAAVCFYRDARTARGAAPRLERQPLSERMRADLEREKALTLRSIKELEFDRAMGKVSDAGLRRDGRRGCAPARSGSCGSSTPGRRCTASHRKRAGRARWGARRRAPAAAASREPRPVAWRRARCGTSNDPDARFCKSCGAKLTGGLMSDPCRAIASLIVLAPSRRRRAGAAQARCPIRKQMSGMPLPVPDVPVAPSPRASSAAQLTNPLAGADRRADRRGATKTAKTDEAGRATFSGLHAGHPRQGRRSPSAASGSSHRSSPSRPPAASA